MFDAIDEILQAEAAEAERLQAAVVAADQVRAAWEREEQELLRTAREQAAAHVREQVDAARQRLDARLAAERAVLAAAPAAVEHDYRDRIAAAAVAVAQIIIQPEYCAQPRSSD